MKSFDTETFHNIDLWTFRSTKTNKRYIVEIEYFEKDFLGIKFYWKGVVQSKNRYSLLTNDYEPRTIVMSCIMVMLNYYKKNPLCSFGFVASESIDLPVGNYKINKRFRFYRRMMLSLFSPKYFLQGYDLKRSLYLLINKKALKDKEITIPYIEEEINKLFIGDFSLSFDSLNN